MYWPNIVFDSGLGFLAEWFCIAVVVLLFDFCVKAAYNLFLHPLRHFPGPKRAAIGTWYEFYHDVVKDGTYLWKIQEMHEKYGPIIRISPRELHICDSTYYANIYAGGRRRVDKDAEAVAAFTVPRASLATVGHDLHRLRRGILGPYFSKRSVVRLESLIVERVERLCERVEEVSKLNGRVDLDAAFAALTADIITQYFYGTNPDNLASPNFKFQVRDAIIGLIGYYHLTRFFPAAATAMKKLPIPIIRLMHPGAADLLQSQEDIRRQILDVLSEDKSKPQRGVILEAFRDPDLPKHETSIDRLQDEGTTIIFAGTETTARALSIMMFHILNEKSHLTRLREELMTIPWSVDQPYKSTQLERLPYLVGIVQEGLRLSHGPLIRLPRVATHDTLKYGDFEIPPGTPVSQSTYFVHMDPKVFPEPFKFQPNRWVQAAKEGVKLDKYMASFTKGSRQCLGISLAYAEMYITIATLVMRFEMGLVDTVEADVGIHHIRLTGYPKNSKGEVKAVVTGRL